MQTFAEPASSTRLVLLRHGRTEWNQVGRAQGHADVPLDSVGLRQARTAARHLATYEPTVLWSSDLVRARETAEQVAARCGLDIVLDKRLREYDVGIRQGLTPEEFEQRHPGLVARPNGSERVSVPGEETEAEVADRMSAVLHDAAAGLGEHDTAVVVGHGASLRTGMLALVGAPAEMSEMLAAMANCAWAVLEQHQRRHWQIMNYNAETLPAPSDLADDPSVR